MNKYGTSYVKDTISINLSGTPTKIGGLTPSSLYAGVKPTANGLLCRVPGIYVVEGSLTLESTDAVFDVVKIQLYQNDQPSVYLGSGNLAGGLNAATTSYLSSLDSFTGVNNRFLDQNVHGALESLSTSDILNSGSPINVTKGTGKLVIVVLAGSDLSGTITVTGDTVDRNTGAVTVGDTENIVLDGLSTDTSDTDAVGNTRHELTAAYITSKWFRGAVTISTTNVNLSDVDTYHCSFSQFNDTGTVTLQTFDINCKPINTAAWLYAYLYSVDVSGSRVNIHRASELVLPASISEANHYYRLREGNLNHAFNASTSGMFVEINEGPDSLAYWEDITVRIWAERKAILSTESSNYVAAVSFQGIFDLKVGDEITLYAYTHNGNVIATNITSGNLLGFSK